MNNILDHEQRFVDLTGIIRFQYFAMLLLKSIMVLSCKELYQYQVPADDD